jgi:Tol biopolymer transport system component
MHKYVPLFSLLLLPLLGLAGCGSSDPPSDDDDNGGGSDNSPLEIAFAGGAAGEEARFSPSGDTIAFIQSSIMGDESDLSVMDAAGNNRKILAPAGTYLAAPAWTPDGSQIYFSADGGISLVSAEGGAASMVVMDFAAMDPDVSPDGKSIVYSINGGSMKLVDLANPATPKDLGQSGTSPRFSPDGQSIAFESGEKINQMTLSTGEVTEILDAGTYLASVDWFPDGQRLAITSDKGIEIVTLGASPSRTLVRDEFAAKNVDLSADGKAILYGINGSTNIFLLEGF